MLQNATKMSRNPFFAILRHAVVTLPYPEGLTIAQYTISRHFNTPVTIQGLIQRIEARGPTKSEEKIADFFKLMESALGLGVGAASHQLNLLVLMRPNLSLLPKLVTLYSLLSHMTPAFCMTFDL